jgi:hypothetical protein
VAVEGVVFDVGGTLVNERTLDAQPGVTEALDRLRQIGIQLIAAGNHTRRELVRDLRSAELQVDLVVSKDEVRENKGSPAWIDYICSVTGLAPNQLLYVGDSHYDMLTAMHRSVVYAHASWSKPRGEYGLTAPAAGWVPAVVAHIFRKRHPWFWQLDATDAAGRRVWARTVLDSRGAGDPALERALVALLKRGIDPRVGPMSLREFIMLHVLASLYASDIPSQVHLWTTYPGSQGDPNAPMAGFLDVAAKLFYRRYDGDLLERTRPAIRSRDAYWKGGVDQTSGAIGAFRNQFYTVQLGDDRARRIRGKHVLVIDNYITRGVSLETARNLLLRAEAKSVYLAAIGKYDFGYHVGSLLPRSEGPPYVIAGGEGFHLSVDEQRGVRYPEARDEFLNSYYSMHSESW